MQSFWISSPHGVVDDVTSSQPWSVTIWAEYCQLGRLTQAFTVHSFLRGLNHILPTWLPFSLQTPLEFQTNTLILCFLSRLVPKSHHKSHGQAVQWSKPPDKDIPIRKDIPGAYRSPPSPRSGGQRPGLSLGKVNSSLLSYTYHTKVPSQRQSGKKMRERYVWER